MDGVADLLSSGMAALRAGDKARAQSLLSRATQLDPNNEQAWLWLSGAVPTPAEQRSCLEQVLRINPQNVAARRGLEKLPPVVSVVPPPPPVIQPSIVPVQPVTAKASARREFIKAAWPGLLTTILMMVVIGFYFLGPKIELPRGSARSTYTPDRIGAYVACQNFVSKQLKAPATAEFESSLDANIRNLGSDRWNVVSHVDAENSFGAQLRMEFDCTVEYVAGEMWRLEDLVTDP